jgi:site-specific DNA-methyltransferase (adenine-specific)
MKYLIKMITPPNGVVLEPFLGSGSTGVAAKELGFVSTFIGIEKEQEYMDIAIKRIGK